MHKINRKIFSSLEEAGFRVLENSTPPPIREVFWGVYDDSHYQTPIERPLIILYLCNYINGAVGKYLRNYSFKK